MNKKLIQFCFIFSFAFTIFSQDLILLKDFTINGKTELKKVKIKKRNEYSYTGNLKMSADKGIVQKLYFYDENDLLVRKLENNYSSKDGLYWYEYNIDKNLFELKFTDDYEETLYSYDDKKRLIRKATSDGKFFTNYIYDENDKLIKTEYEWGTIEYKYNSKNQWTHSVHSTGDKEYYEYDNMNRVIYYRRENDYVSEIFYKYDDEKHTKEDRRVTKYEDKTIFDITDYYQYDSEDNLIYSKCYSDISYNTSELLDTVVEETFYEYDEQGFLLHIRTIKSTAAGEKEKNEFYENFVWDNGNLNTEIIYEEVE